MHHTKAIWTHVQNEGLVVEFNTNDEIKNVVRRLMALAFLPIMMIRINFSIIENCETIRNNSKLQCLCAYYKSTWLNGVFPLAMWNVNNASTRTNNFVEGWHNKLNKGLMKIHPNIFEVITYLKKEEKESQQYILRARNGIPAPNRRRKYIKLDKRMHYLIFTKVERLALLIF